MSSPEKSLYVDTTSAGPKNIDFSDTNVAIKYKDYEKLTATEIGPNAKRLLRASLTAWC